MSATDLITDLATDASFQDGHTYTEHVIRTSGLPLSEDALRLMLMTAFLVGHQAGVKGAGFMLETFAKGITHGR